MKKIAIILSGSGYLDGSEITEAVSLKISLGPKAELDFFAPDKDFVPVAHFDPVKMGSEKRNCLEESSRITRGQIKNINELQISRYDGLALPGGYGIAKNLSTWAQDGAGCSLDADLKRIVQGFYENSKPILAACIAPAVIARILGMENPSVTIGDDTATIEEIKKTGAEHVNCAVNDFVSDRENKIISTPAYMYDAQAHEVFEGIQKASQEFLEMC